MENRVYYGEYSLKHWIDLILKGNITLPEYQRLFVWDEKKVATLIETFTKKQFVPPITIGAFKENGTNQNLILDGQQRLTSIFLAYLGLFPDEAKYRRAIENFPNENDDEEDEENPSQLDNILTWNFKMLTKKGKTKTEILQKIVNGSYKTVNWNIDEEFLKSTFLGFSYLVPNVADEKEQQKYYSSVFRNINIQGEILLPQESRASLYFLDKNLNAFFQPEFINSLVIKNLTNENKIDFVRYLSLLSQYAKDENTSRLARGFKPKMEKYYEEYIYSVVGEVNSESFKEFSEIFPNKDFTTPFERLRQAIEGLEIPKNYSSIIELDIYFFGLIYLSIFENKEFDYNKKDDLIIQLNQKIEQLKNDDSHTKAPSALKYLKERLNASIEIYNQFLNE